MADAATSRLPALARPRTRDALVLDQLARWVQASGLGPGDRLPPERDLAQQLEVGRSTVREGLKRWEALGLIEMRVGSGTYLRAEIVPGLVHVGLSFKLELPKLLEALEVRRALEGAAAGIAARRTDAEGLARMQQALLTMEAVHARDGTAPEEDWAFHLSIYQAAGNGLMEAIIVQLQDVMHRFWEHPFGAMDFAARSFPLHRELFEAIRAGDPARARQLTDSIIDITLEDLLDAAHGS